MSWSHNLSSLLLVHRHQAGNPERIGLTAAPPLPGWGGSTAQGHYAWVLCNHLHIWRQDMSISSQLRGESKCRVMAMGDATGQQGASQCPVGTHSRSLQEWRWKERQPGRPQVCWSLQVPPQSYSFFLLFSFFLFFRAIHSVPLDHRWNSALCLGN